MDIFPKDPLHSAFQIRPYETPNKSDIYHMTGYPAPVGALREPGDPPGSQWATELTLHTNSNHNMLFYKDAATKANAGSPIYHKSQEGRYVAIGMHCGGYTIQNTTKFNFGLRITPPMISEIVHGVTGLKLFLFDTVKEAASVKKKRKPQQSTSASNNNCDETTSRT